MIERRPDHLPESDLRSYKVKKNLNTIHHSDRLNFVSIVIAVLVNVLLSYAMSRFNLPIYLDTIGTVAVSSLCGLFPGILTAMVTNLVCLVYNTSAIYFAIINVLIAMFTVWVIRNKKFKKVTAILVMIVGNALIAGILSAFIQLELFDMPQNGLIADTVKALKMKSDSIPEISIFLFANIILNLVDKGISVGAALLVLHLIPQDTKDSIKSSRWKQKPLSEEERNSIKAWGSDIKHSVRTRTTMILLGVAVAITFVIAVIGLNLFYNKLKEENVQIAQRAAQVAGSVIDTDKIDEYLRDGEAAEGYKETEDLLYTIRASAVDVKYLYITVMKEEGCYMVFDLDVKAEDGTLIETGYEPGEAVDFEEAFLPYIPALIAGEGLPEPVISEDSWGWLMSVYEPVKNKDGKTVCYACADISMPNMMGELRGFLFKVLLILSGFFVLILSFGLWNTGMYTVYPINSIAECVDNFVTSGDSQEVFDENVKKLRSLDIQTGDEVEKLYRSVCAMALNQAEQMRDIRHYAEASSKMQSGLIITMADMVENRDSDTGAHVQKTSAYAKLIAEGLRDKGYYVGKISNEFISAVAMSAPLHDVGKICIPDGILNKPGKLTDEEYAIMKTHTTEGRKIMEKAISTVKGENYLKEARNMAGYHHERWDGKGYPEGLHGEVIPLSARIMAVADVFDALASPRVYKPAFPLDKALSIIQEGAGTQFDPKCVEVFMDALPEVKRILKKYQEG